MQLRRRVASPRLKWTYIQKSGLNYTTLITLFDSIQHKRPGMLSDGVVLQYVTTNLILLTKLKNYWKISSGKSRVPPLPHTHMHKTVTIWYPVTISWYLNWRKDLSRTEFSSNSDTKTKRTVLKIMGKISTRLG